MPYEPSEDILYENAVFVNQILKARDYIGQAFEVMNNAAQWGGGGVGFNGHDIMTGSRKGLHAYWDDHVARKRSADARYSDIPNIQVRKVQKSLRNCLLFAMRMNLHSRRVRDANGYIKGILDQNNQFVHDQQNPDSSYLKEIGWIIDPIEFVAKNFGAWLNDINNNVTMGVDTNWGAVTRGSQGRLFEIINSTAYNFMALRPEIIDIDVFDVQIGSQKPLLESQFFLEV